MSDEQKSREQEQSKKSYTTPDLTVYGSVEELTRGNQGQRSTDISSWPGARPAKTPTPTPKKP